MVGTSGRQVLVVDVRRWMWVKGMFVEWGRGQGLGQERLVVDLCGALCGHEEALSSCGQATVPRYRGPQNTHTQGAGAASSHILTHASV